MSGSPIIPIQFFGKVTSHTNKGVFIEPVEEVQETIEYLTRKDVEVFKFRASPSSKDAADRDFDGLGNIENELSPAAPIPPKRGGGDGGT